MFVWPDSMPDGAEHLILALLPLAGFVQWILLGLFFAWRVLVCMRHRNHLGRHVAVTAVLYPCLVFVTNVAAALLSE